MLANFRPVYAIESFGQVNPSALVERHPNIKGISHDIDGYLANYHGLELPLPHLRVIEDAASLGLLQAVISNAEKPERLARAEEFVDMLKAQVGLPELPLVTSGTPGLRRKPDPLIFKHAAKLLGLQPDEMCHGGDQMAKDVLGANRAGYGVTILSRRYGPGDDIRVRLLQRPLEAATRSFLGIDFSATFDPHDNRLL